MKDSPRINVFKNVAKNVAENVVEVRTYVVNRLSGSGQSNVRPEDIQEFVIKRVDEKFRSCTPPNDSYVKDICDKIDEYLRNPQVSFEEDEYFPDIKTFTDFYCRSNADYVNWYVHGLVNLIQMRCSRRRLKLLRDILKKYIEKKHDLTEEDLRQLYEKAELREKLAHS